MDDPGAASEELEVWCRLVTSGARVLRVQIMHPDGQVLTAYPPDRFPPAVVRQMLAGQIRAALSRPGRLLHLTDLTGQSLFEERLDPSGG